MVNEISRNIGRKQLKALVNRLNLSGSQAIEGEYELAVVLGLTYLGDVCYEPNLGGSSRPDVLFRAKDGIQSEFVADVTCVSQTSLNSRAPFDFLIREFQRLMEPYEIGIEGFHFQVGFKKEGAYGDQKLTLKIPRRKEITRILEAEIPEIASAIQKQQKGTYKTHINKNGLDVEVSYTPGGLFVGGGHPADYLPRSLEHNPIFEALVRKALQLDKSGYNGTKGIFLCDAGSYIVEGRFQPEPFSLEDILRHFFREHPQISFVCTCFSVQVGMESRMLLSPVNLRGPYRISGNFFSNPNAQQPVSESLKKIVCNFPRHLPNSESSGLNAQNWLYAHPEVYGRSHIGGLTMSDNSVKFSLRALQELLAGRINQERFFQAHGFVSDGIGPIVRNPFDEALERGKLIAAMTVESDPDRDDDWVVVRFGYRDPAISKISMPDSRSVRGRG